MTKLKLDLFRIVAGIAIVLLIAANVYGYFRQPKIAYVRSHDMIEKYQGTLEARSEFEKKKNTMVSTIDSLKMDFERAKNQYILNMSKLSVNQRIEQEKILTQQQNQVAQYSQAIDERIQEEDNKMMQEVLNQINSFVEGYAIRKNYSLILGTTSSGSLLYGEKTYDITDVLLKELNDHYKGK